MYNNMLPTMYIDLGKIPKESGQERIQGHK